MIIYNLCHMTRIITWTMHNLNLCIPCHTEYQILTIPIHQVPSSAKCCPKQWRRPGYNSLFLLPKYLKCSNWRVDATAKCHLFSEPHLFIAIITLLFDIFHSNDWKISFKIHLHICLRFQWNTSRIFKSYIS